MRHLTLRAMRPIRLLTLVAVFTLGLSACASGPATSSPRASGAPRQAAAHRQDESSAADGDESAGLSSAGFAGWVRNFRRQARARGVAPSTLASAFDDAVFAPHVIELDRRQPEFNRPIWTYLDAAVSSARVRHGRQVLAAHRDVVRDVARRYGVSPDIMAAIWGIESNYGQNVGHYETIDALATLGYDGRREDFAKRQLYAALKILGDGDIERDRMRGSWAGAMGNTQFLPTSFLRYAVDADGDGKRDIWGSIDDTLASTAHYLKSNGWRAGSPWGREVMLPPGFDYALADGETRHSSAQWRALGVRPVDRRGLPAFAAGAIIAPAGAHGPTFMVGHNFRVILRYNNATSYALAVGLLADRLAGHPGVQGGWPRDLASLSRDAIRRLQADLNTLGYDSGAPDGIVGPNTRRGVRAYQRAHGLIADGYPTDDLLQQIAAAVQ